MTDTAVLAECMSHVGTSTYRSLNLTQLFESW